ncbi:tyrosine-protein phosphatase [Actinospica robiniae]|uniref:tyrosine-protein phosphatase n=1 Tax=Actinospica robiniae TaxID=304901 RepID=UPI00042850D6|nr:tyrosine-protein phosphatase [Actinospica robiniae]
MSSVEEHDQSAITLSAHASTPVHPPAPVNLPPATSDSGASSPAYSLLKADAPAKAAASFDVGLPAAYLDEVGLERVLNIAGVHNARDLGGLSGTLGTVRRGRVLRSAALDKLTPAGARTLADLGLRTIFDLRTQEERDEAPSRLSHAELTAVDLVVLDYLGTLDDLPGGQMEMYLHIVERSATGIVDLLEQLGRPNAAPALVHCTAGKDRTGLTIALLLDLLGVPRTAIVADYVASNNGLLGRIRTNVSAGLLEDTLAALDERYGSPRGYLEAHGLTEATVAALRAELLEATVAAS